MPGSGSGADRGLRALVGRRAPGGGARHGGRPAGVARPSRRAGAALGGARRADGRGRSPDSRQRAVRAVRGGRLVAGRGLDRGKPHPRPAPTAAAGRPGDGRADGGGRRTVPAAGGHAGTGAPAAAGRDRARVRRVLALDPPDLAVAARRSRTGGLRRGEPAGRGASRAPRGPGGKADRCCSPNGGRCDPHRPRTPARSPAGGGSRTVVRWSCSARRTEGPGRFTNSPPRTSPVLSLRRGGGGCRCGHRLPRPAGPSGPRSPRPPRCYRRLGRPFRPGA